MLFGRNKKTAPADRRAHYRDPLDLGEALPVSVRLPGGETVHGAAVDLTVLGAGVDVPAGEDPKLEKGEAVELTIHGPAHEWQVRSPARVCYLRPDGVRHVRYGFQLINPGDLYAQLDHALGHYFNRRRRPRVHPDLDRPIFVRLATRSFELTAEVHDLSATGMGILLMHEEAPPILREVEAEVCFDLPEERQEVRGRARVRQRVRLSRWDLLGLQFDLDDPKGIRRHERALARYVAMREGEVAEWLQEYSA